jgi:XTP/dITP diphosphohydrolase
VKLIVVSSNKNKINEILSIFSDLTIEVEGHPNPPHVVEDGDTFEANAKKKLEPIPEFEGKIFIADDSGLEVEALNGAPGIYSARYAGPDASSELKCQKILAEMGGQTQRTANFTCAIALKFPNGDLHCVEGKVFGQIAPSISGSSGFGYDPIFIPDGLDRTFAEIPAGVKNRMSHRYRALIQARDLIAQFLA